MTTPLTHNTEFDLPVFPSGITIHHSSEQIEQAAAAAVLMGEHYIYRRVSVSKIGGLSIKERLQIAKNEFSTVANLTGASIAEHQWGLYPDHEGSTPTNLRGIVAKVAVIKPVEIDDPQIMRSLQDGISKYWFSPVRNTGSYRLFDVDRRQCVYGVPLNREGLEEPQMHYVDMDVNLEER